MILSEKSATFRDHALTNNKLMLEKLFRRLLASPKGLQARHNLDAEIRIRNVDRSQPGSDPGIEGVVVDADDPRLLGDTDPHFRSEAVSPVSHEVARTEEPLRPRSSFDELSGRRVSDGEMRQ